jgi:hypothetical protein
LPILRPQAFRKYGAPEAVIRQIADGWSLPLKRDPPLLRGDELARAGLPTASALAEMDFVTKELQKLQISGAVRRATADELAAGVCLGDLVVARTKGELYGQRGQGWADEPAAGSAGERIAARDGTLSKCRLCYDVSRSLAPCEDLAGAEYNVVDWTELVDAMRMHGPYTAREDFKAGFHHLCVCTHDQRYLAFRSPVDGQIYVWQRLPFGLRCSPWLFGQVARPLLLALRDAGHCVFLQVDDLIFVGSCVAEVHSGVRMARRVASELGIVLSLEKSVLPNQVNRILGMQLDGRTGLLEMPQLRRERYLRMLRDFRGRCCARRWTTRAVLDRIIGVCSHVAGFVPLLRHLLEPLYAAMDSVVASEEIASSSYMDPHLRMVLGADVPRVVDAWISWLDQWSGRIYFEQFDTPQMRRNLRRRFTWSPPLVVRPDGTELALLPIRPRTVEQMCVLRTDASATGGGAHATLSDGEAWTARCRWTLEERVLGSAVRELRALIVALRQLQREGLLARGALPGSCRALAWISDSQAAVKAVRKGSSRIPGMEAALRALALWESRTGVRVWPFWAPREQLSRADELSRHWSEAYEDVGLDELHRPVVTAIGSQQLSVWHSAEPRQADALHAHPVSTLSTIGRLALDTLNNDG